MQQRHGMWVLGFLTVIMLFAGFAPAQVTEPPQFSMSRTIIGLNADSSLPLGTTQLVVEVTVQLVSGSAGLIQPGSYYVEERWPLAWKLNNTDGGCPPDGPSSDNDGLFQFTYNTVPTFPCTFLYGVEVSTTPELPALIEGEVYFRTDGGLLSGGGVSSTIYPPTFTVELIREIPDLGPGNSLPTGATVLTVNVTVRVPVGSPTALLSFGLQERWPSGWRFGDAFGPCVPPVRPSSGAQGNFNFSYADVPPFPCSFSYTIMVPDPAALPAIVEGQTQYNLAGIGTIQSDIVRTEIVDAPLQVALQRDIAGLNPDGNLIPGTSTLEVTLVIDAPAGDVSPISFFGVEERWPAGWSLAGVSGFCFPDARDEGAGLLRFNFDTVPNLPCNFVYMVNVPTSPVLPATVSGEALYRVGGGLLTSETVEKVIPAEVTTVSFTRGFSGPGLNGGEYVPGEEITVEIDVDKAGAAVITALSFTDSAPSDWEFVGVGGVNPPDVIPAVGAEGTLNFAYTTPPLEFPASFTYTLAIPQDALDQQCFEGAAAFSTPFAGDVSPTDSVCLDEPPCIAFLRNAPATYQPGQTVDIDITLNSTCTGLVTALGLNETLPTGWSFVSVTGANVPPIVPAVGAMGAINFAWIDVPAFPASFTFTVQAAADSTGPQSISGTALYRIGAGLERATQTVVTGIAVGDIIAPTAVCRDIAVSLGASGTVSITPALVDGGSFDNVGIVSRMIDRDTFDCGDIGPNTVTLTVEDAVGNQGFCTAVVTIEDNLAPTVTAQNVTVFLNAAGTAAITVSDVLAGSNDNCGTPTITLSHDTFTCGDLGTNSVTLTATDTQGNQGSAIATVTVVDNILPVITVLGPNPVTIDCNTAYTDAGATANDNCAADLTDSITVTNPVDTAADGVYLVTYAVADASGNLAQATRTVIVDGENCNNACAPDLTPPVITLNGAAAVNVECGDNYADAGATALDDCDGDLTASIVVVNPVNTAAPGAYTVRYNVQDAAGNTAQEVTRNVVVQDTAAPVITLLGENPVTVDCGTVYADAGATATDACDGDVNVTIDDSLVDTSAQNLAGFVVTITATDAQGNTSSAQRLVVVDGPACVDECAPDTTPPVITLLGENPVTVECGDTFADPGATATDLCDGDLTAGIATEGAADAGVPGTYLVRYIVSDAAGNEATATRTVIVEDTAPPVITLLGAGTVTVDCGATYTDAGATATDACDGDVAVVTDASAVNTAVANPGGYTVTFTATDASGNAATATRTVIVDGPACAGACGDDRTPPVITLRGPATITVDCGTPYTDAGATATDNCDGDVTVTVNSSAVDTSRRNTAGYTVTFTATDASGNEARATRTVLVDGPGCDTPCDPDRTPPEITLNGSRTVTVECGAAYTDAGATATDACDGNLTSRIALTGTVNTAVPGTYTLTYTVRDNAGNTATETRQITVADSTRPTALCRSAAVVLDSQGRASLTPGDVDNGSFDNCGAITMAVSPSSFGCEDVGEQTVTLTVTDAAGNRSACEATVTVRNNTPPTAVCNEVVLELDASRRAELNPALVSAGSSGLCGVASVSVSQRFFDCSDLGRNPVQVTVRGTSGGQQTCTAMVFVVSDFCEDIAGEGEGEIEETGTLIVRVNDAATNLGIPYAVVRVARGTEILRVVSRNRDGVFMVSIPGPGAYEAVVSAEGHTAALSTVTFAGFETITRDFNLTRLDERRIDSDGDGLPDDDEILLYGTDPNNPDTDGDGMPDLFEVEHRLAPTSYEDPNDPSRRVRPEDDLDDDGFTNIEEFQMNADPRDPNSPFRTFFVSPEPGPPGNGNRGRPFRSINGALESIAAKGLRPEKQFDGPDQVQLLMMPGEFDEDVVLPAGIILSGSRRGVATVRGIMRTGPDNWLRYFVLRARDAAPAEPLILIDGASVHLEGLTITGATPQSRAGVGIRVEGMDGESVRITACLVTGLDTGLEVTGTLPLVRRTRFEDLASYGIRVLATSMPVGANSLGDVSNLTSGWNRFAEIGITSVANERDELILMQINDWDTDNPAAVENIITGPNEFVPFLPKNAGILPATVVATLWDDVTRKRITDGQITVSPGGFQPVTENIEGVYTINALPSGNYEVGANAVSYAGQRKNISITGGARTAVSFPMGEQEPVKNCGCATGGGGPLAGRGDVIAVLLAVALLLGAGRKRKPEKGRHG